MSTFKKSIASLAIFSFGMIATSSVNQLAAANCDWRSVNHDLHNTRSNPCESVISPDNVVNLQQLWSVGTNSVQAAPVFDNGIVYFADISGNIYANDATNGAPILSTNLGAPIKAAPLVTATTVYVATTDLVLYALDKTTFSTLWSVVIDPVAQATGQATVESSPVIVEDLVIVGVACSEWAETTSPILSMRGSLNAFNAADLSPAWQYVPTSAIEGFGVGFWSTPAFDTHRKLLFVGTSNTSTFPAAKVSDSLLAIHYKTGKLKWYNQFTKNDVFGFVNPTGPNKDVGASPNLFSAHCKGHHSSSSSSSSSSRSHKNRNDLVGVCSKAGVYRALERNSGKLVWETTISKSGTRTGNPSAAVHGDTIYAVCTEDLTYSINGPTVVQANLDCNELAWDMWLQGLFYTQNSVIKALDTCTGRVKWTDVSPSTTFSSLAEANGVLYHANFVGQLRCLDATSGTLLNVIGSGNPNDVTLVAPITVADGKVFVGQGSDGFGSTNGLAVYAVP